LFSSVRHQHNPVKCVIEKLSNETKVTFSEPIRAIAPGHQQYFMIVKYVWVAELFVRLFNI